ncbi:MAG: phosphodiester glycosidase family protein [Clostridiales bacterium]|nr:phosphodiester glycosidase family protein [Clostridiales bacterium]
MNRKEENRKLDKYAVIAIIMAVSLGVSAFLCGCANKESSEFTPTPSATKPIQPTKTLVPSQPASESPTKAPDNPPEKSPVEYNEKILKINGRQNHVFLLTIDIRDYDISVVPYLAFDRIFGFEYLQSMTEATGALAGVNAGFFFEYGLPSGLVVNNGEIISGGTGKFYSLIIDENGAWFEIVKTTVNLNINGQEIQLESYNKSPGDSKTAVFSSAYGKTDRLGYFRRAMVIENDVITEYKKVESAVDIPKDGYVVMLPADFAFETDPMGANCTVEFTPSYSDSTMAYECASLLVKEGESLAGDTMPWVGNLNHYDPRTCVGIMQDGRLGFVVIDGRRENYSSGITGRETADLMIELGFIDAAMLDGGGSSQMIYDGITMNSPSSGPNGRPIAGGFMIILDND